MALQDTLTQTSMTLARAEGTLSYIFDQILGNDGAKTVGCDPQPSGLHGLSATIMQRVEQLDSKLETLRDALITPTPQLGQTTNVGGKVCSGL